MEDNELECLQKSRLIEEQQWKENRAKINTVRRM